MTPQRMADILKAKLTREEFLDLQSLMDNDPPAGPLYEAITARAQQMAPEEFADARQN